MRVHSQPTTSPVLQRKCDCGSQSGASGACSKCASAKPLRRDAEPQTGEVPPIVYDVLRSPGQPLDPATRSFMEPRFEHDFSAVRVHTGPQASASAAAVGARAYTVERNIVFGDGQYQPNDTSGQWVLAHELAHVVHQQGTAGEVQTLSTVGDATDSFEREADNVADKVLKGETVHVDQRAGKPMVQRLIMEQPAGGCGICYGPREAGNVAHWLIQQEFEILYPFALRNFPPQVTSRLQFLPDLVLPTPAGLKIGEIKPANARGYFDGSAKMAAYIPAFQAAYPNSVIEPLDVVLPPAVTVFPNPQTPACYQELFVNPPISGVYGYYCEPPFSQLVGRPQCRCRNTRERVRVRAAKKEENKKKAPETKRVEDPGLQPAPSPLRQITDFVLNVIETGADVEEAAMAFLRANPHLIDYLIGAAVTAIVATIIEDILTLGAGIADDPLIIGICVQLIRLARAAKAGALAL
jgi:hypothetical protein